MLSFSPSSNGPAWELMAGAVMTEFVMDTEGIIVEIGDTRVLMVIWVGIVFDEQDRSVSNMSRVGKLDEVTMKDSIIIIETKSDAQDTEDTMLRSGEYLESHMKEKDELTNFLSMATAIIL